MDDDMLMIIQWRPCFDIFVGEDVEAVTLIAGRANDAIIMYYDGLLDYSDVSFLSLQDAFRPRDCSNSYARGCCEDPGTLPRLVLLLVQQMGPKGLFSGQWNSRSAKRTGLCSVTPPPTITSDGSWRVAIHSK